MKKNFIFSLIILVSMLCFQFFPLEAKARCESEFSARDAAKSAYETARKTADELATKLAKKQGVFFLGDSQTGVTDAVEITRLQNEVISARLRAVNAYNAYQSAEASLEACLDNTPTGPSCDNPSAHLVLCSGCNNTYYSASCRISEYDQHRVRICYQRTDYYGVSAPSSQHTYCNQSFRNCDSPRGTCSSGPNQGLSHSGS